MRLHFSKLDLTFESELPIIDAANNPALKAPLIAKQPTGTAFGICAIESKLSKPFNFLVSIGTPRTGNVVKDATMPAK